MMGYASRLNPATTDEAQRRFRVEAHLRGALALFPDRATFEQWVTARGVPEDVRAHMEQLLPARLQQQELA